MARILTMCPGSCVVPDEGTDKDLDFLKAPAGPVNHMCVHKQHKSAFLMCFGYI